MKIVALILLIVAGPILLFLGWFRRLSWLWFGIWFVIGGAICGAFFYTGATAPPEDWGYTSGIAGLWIIFWFLGGFIQMVRLLK